MTKVLVGCSPSSFPLDRTNAQYYVIIKDHPLWWQSCNHLILIKDASLFIWFLESLHTAAAELQTASWQGRQCPPPCHRFLIISPATWVSFHYLKRVVCVCARVWVGLSQTDTSGYSEVWNYFKTLTGCQRSLRLLPSSLKKEATSNDLSRWSSAPKPHCWQVQ